MRVRRVVVVPPRFVAVRRWWQPSGDHVAELVELERDVAGLFGRWSRNTSYLDTGAPHREWVSFLVSLSETTAVLSSHWRRPVLMPLWNECSSGLARTSPSRVAARRDRSPGRPPQLKGPLRHSAPLTDFPRPKNGPPMVKRPPRPAAAAAADSRRAAPARIDRTRPELVARIRDLRTPVPAEARPDGCEWRPTGIRE